jgi:hypothetical protein
VIRRSLQQAKAATYSILFPSAANQGLPTAHGTGFLISPAGHFLTARHVVERNSVPEAWLMQSTAPEGYSPILQWPELVS